MAFIEPMHRNKPNITYLLTTIWGLLRKCLSKLLQVLQGHEPIISRFYVQNDPMLLHL